MWERAERSAVRPEKPDKYRGSHIKQWTIMLIEYFCKYLSFATWEIFALSFILYKLEGMACWVTLTEHLPTVDRDRPILAELLFCFMYLANEIDKALSWFWHSLFRPVCELKLPYCSWLSILGTEGGKTERECTDPALQMQQQSEIWAKMAKNNWSEVKWSETRKPICGASHIANPR